MTGTKEGGATLRLTMIEKFGSEEAWREWMRANASKGGKASLHTGFALMDRERVVAIGRKGGLISRRPKKINE